MPHAGTKCPTGARWLLAGRGRRLMFEAISNSATRLAHPVQPEDGKQVARGLGDMFFGLGGDLDAEDMGAPPITAYGSVEMALHRHLPTDRGGSASWPAIPSDRGCDGVGHRLSRRPGCRFTRGSR